MLRFFLAAAMVVQVETELRLGPDENFHRRDSQKRKFPSYGQPPCRARAKPATYKAKAKGNLKRYKPLAKRHPTTDKPQPKEEEPVQRFTTSMTFTSTRATFR
jgi:hypothetical protein